MNQERNPTPSESARERKRSLIARWILIGLSAACAVVVTLSASHVRAQNAPEPRSTARRTRRRAADHRADRALARPTLRSIGEDRTALR